MCRLAAAVERLDGRLVACAAADHDEAVARTSHVPHVAAQALARLIAGDPLRAALTGGGYRDMTRVARSDAALWAEILLANRARCSPVSTRSRPGSVTIAPRSRRATARGWRERGTPWRARSRRAARPAGSRPATGPARGTRCSPSAAPAVRCGGCGSEGRDLVRGYEVSR